MLRYFLGVLFFTTVLFSAEPRTTESEMQFNREYNNAKDTFDKAVKVAQDKLVALLREEMKRLTSKGDLDGAIAIRNKIDELTQDWIIIFRSDNPELWLDKTAKIKLDAKYLKLKRCDTNEFIIISIERDKLNTIIIPEDSIYGWQGTATLDHNARVLGVFRKDWSSKEKGAIGLVNGNHYKGWGFGIRGWINDKQGYAWNGKEIQKTEFEISIKNKLTSQEMRWLCQ